MKLITLEGYDDTGFGKIRAKKLLKKTKKYGKYAGAPTLAPVFIAKDKGMIPALDGYSETDFFYPVQMRDEDFSGLGKFKVKKLVKKAVPKKIQKIAKKATPPIVKKAVKQVMKTAKIAVPIAAMSLGIPPGATAAALKAVSDGAATLDDLKKIAEENGLPAEKLMVASEMISSDSPEERQQKIEALKEKDPQAGKDAEEMDAEMRKVEQKAGEKLGKLNDLYNGYTAKLFKAGRIK